MFFPTTTLSPRIFNAEQVARHKSGVLQVRFVGTS